MSVYHVRHPVVEQEVLECGKRAFQQNYIGSVMTSISMPISA